jgi:hypothetical protein
MDLVIEKAAIKALRRLQPKLSASILTKLEVIAADPAASHANVKPLMGRKAQRMHVLDIDTRGGIYK